jgi:hypothetical protein
LADHETDQTVGTGAAGAEPDAPETGQDAVGTFRWPSAGRPSFLGQQPEVADIPVADIPVADIPVADIPVAAAPAGPVGGWSQSLGTDGQPWESYRQPWAGAPPAGTEGPDASQEPAEPRLADGYGTAGSYGRSAGFDPPDGDPLAEYDVTPVTGRPLPPAGPPPGQRAETADSLTTDLLLPGRHAAPPGGWRRALYYLTGGLVRASVSAAEVRRRELASRACTPVATGHHRVAVLSLKGGVGKTTTVMGLGSTLASLRGDCG